MSNIPKNVRTIFFVGIALLFASVLLYIAGIYLTFSAQGETAGIREETNIIRAQEESRRKTVEAFRAIEEEKDALLSFVLAKNDDVKLIEQIEELAKKASVVAQNSSVSLEDIPDVSSAKYVKIVGSATGTYINVYRFLRFLEEFPQASVLEEVELAQFGPGDKGKAREWRLSYVLKTVKEQ